MLRIGCHLVRVRRVLLWGGKRRIGANVFQFFYAKPARGTAKPLDERDIEDFLNFAGESKGNSICLGSRTLYG